MVKSCIKKTLFFWPWYDLWRSLKVIDHDGKWKFTYDFLSVVNSNYMARKHRFEDTGLWKYCDLNLTFQGHPRSKVIRGNESSHMTSYLLLIVTTWLGNTVLKIQGTPVVSRWLGSMTLNPRVKWRVTLHRDTRDLAPWPWPFTLYTILPRLSLIGSVSYLPDENNLFKP